MAIHTELKIYKASHELLVVVVKLIKNMPRDFKQSIGNELRDECVQVARQVFKANVARDKSKYLLDLVEHVQIAELWLRISRDLGFISTGQYAEAVKLTDSIGRQATGWRKSASPAT